MSDVQQTEVVASSPVGEVSIQDLTLSDTAIENDTTAPAIPNNEDEDAGEFKPMTEDERKQWFFKLGPVLKNAEDEYFRLLKKLKAQEDILTCLVEVVAELVRVETNDEANGEEKDGSRSKLSVCGNTLRWE